MTLGPCKPAPLGRQPSQNANAHCDHTASGAAIGIKSLGGLWIYRCWISGLDAAVAPAAATCVSDRSKLQVRALVNSGDLQLSLFDEQNLAEIASKLYPSERLIVCRNPAVAAERARKRESMLQATETELGKVKTMVDGERGTLRNALAGKIGERAGKVINKYKMAKHFELEISDGSFSYQRKNEQIATEAALDGFYVIRSTSQHPTLTSRAPCALQALKTAKR